MMPTLFSATTSDFSTNGIGGLSDAISCKVTEERNGTFEMEMTYPVGGAHYEDLVHSNIIKVQAAPGGTPQLFRIYGITKPIGGIVTINAEHISYQLSYIPVAKFTAGSAAEAVAGLGSHAMTTCPFTFWTDKETVATYNQEVVANIRERMGGVQGSILDVYGGEWEFDNYTVKLHKHRGTDLGVTLRYGKNITDIQQEENIANTYTGIVGYFRSDEAYVVTDVINHANSGSYPFQRIKVVDFSGDYETPPTKANLTAHATAYMNRNNFGVPKVSIDVSFVALWQTEEYKNIAPLERVWLCDTINVEFEKLGISTTAKVVKTVYDVLLDRYESIEVGESRTNLSHQMAETEIEVNDEFDTTISELERSIKRNTKLVTGGLGGYVYMKPNADGYPEEILIMDQPDIDTAVQIWRMNQGGIAHSSNGYDGPFTVGMYMNGEINATLITAGSLTANIIKAGLLKSIATQLVEGVNVPVFQLNIDTGAVKAYKLSVESPNFKLTEAGAATMHSATIDGGDINFANGTFHVESNGALTASNATINGGGINFANGQFVVTSQGAVTAQNADIHGSVVSETSDQKVSISNGELQIFNKRYYSATDPVFRVMLGANGSSIWAPEFIELLCSPCAFGISSDGTSRLQTESFMINNSYTQSGSFVDGNGNTITVEHGLITGGL